MLFIIDIMENVYFYLVADRYSITLYNFYKTNIIRSISDADFNYAAELLSIYPASAMCQITQITAMCNSCYWSNEME